MALPPPAIVRRIPKGGTRSYRRIKAQIKYISRDGEIEVYGSSRYTSGPLTQQDIDNTLRDWVEGTGDFTPGQGEARAGRDLTTHLVLSFPERTQDGERITEDQVRRIGRRWMRRLFNSANSDRSQDGGVRFDYLAALHTDTDNYHFHVVVNRRAHGDDGIWLSIANQPRPRTSPRSIGLSYTELRRVLQEEAARENIGLDARAFPIVTPLIIDPDQRPAIYPLHVPPPWQYPVPTLPASDVSYDDYLEDGYDSDDDSDDDSGDSAGGHRVLRAWRQGAEDGAPGPSGMTAAQKAADVHARRQPSTNDAATDTDAGPSNPTGGRKRASSDDAPVPPSKRRRPAEATPELEGSPAGAHTVRTQSAPATPAAEPDEAIALSDDTPGTSATANGPDSGRSSPSARADNVAAGRKRRAASAPYGEPPAKRTPDRGTEGNRQERSSDPGEKATTPSRVDSDMPADSSAAMADASSPAHPASPVPELQEDGSSRNTPLDAGVDSYSSQGPAADETAPTREATPPAPRDAAPGPASRRRGRRTQLELLLDDRRPDEVRPMRLRPRKDRAQPIEQNRQDDGRGR